MVSLNASIILVSQIFLSSDRILVDFVFLPNSSELYFRSVTIQSHALSYRAQTTTTAIIENADSKDSQMNCFCPSCLQGPSDIMTSQGLNHNAGHCARPSTRPALLRAQDSLRRSEQIPTVWEMSFLNIDLDKLLEMLFSSVAALRV
jgi:hypothetical protein